MEKISIIIPIYDVQEYLPKCLDSVIAQSYSDLQIILVDDGSSDDSFEICCTYKEKDSRIEVYSQYNQGVSAARNLGLKHSIGKWIAFIDADDWIEANFIKTLYSAAKTQTDIVIGDYITDRKNGAKTRQAGFAEEFTAQTTAELQELEKICVLPHCHTHLVPQPLNFLAGVWGKLYRSSVIRNHKIQFPEELRISEDVVFNIFFLEHSVGAEYVSCYGYHYFERSSSVMRSNKPEKVLYFTDYMEYIAQSISRSTIKNLGKKELNAVIIRDFYSLAANGYYLDICSHNFLKASRKMQEDIKNQTISEAISDRKKSVYLDKRHCFFRFLMQHRHQLLFIIFVYLKKIIKREV